jgi:hypothetical protein
MMPILENRDQRNSATDGYERVAKRIPILRILRKSYG